MLNVESTSIPLSWGYISAIPPPQEQAEAESSSHHVRCSLGSYGCSSPLLLLIVDLSHLNPLLLLVVYLTAASRSWQSCPAWKWKWARCTMRNRGRSSTSRPWRLASLWSAALPAVVCWLLCPVAHCPSFIVQCLFISSLSCWMKSLFVKQYLHFFFLLS